MPVSVEEALRSWLVSDTGVNALVSVTGIWKEYVPQDFVVVAGVSAVSYRVLGDTPGLCLDGPSGDSVARVGLTLVCASEADLKALTQAITGTQAAVKLHGFRGWLGTAPTRVWAQHVRVEDRPDDFEPDRHGADRGEWLSHMAVVVCYLSG